MVKVAKGRALPTSSSNWFRSVETYHWLVRSKIFVLGKDIEASTPFNWNWGSEWVRLSQRPLPKPRLHNRWYCVRDLTTLLRRTFILYAATSIWLKRQGPRQTTRTLVNFTASTDSHNHPYKVNVSKRWSWKWPFIHGIVEATDQLKTHVSNPSEEFFLPRQN